MTFAEMQAANPTMRRASSMQPELHDGQRVRVLWAGGNGPHEYLVSMLWGFPWAATILPDGSIHRVAALSGIDLVEIVG